MLVGPGYLELVHEIAGLPPGSRVGLVCANERGADNMLETLRLSGTTGIEIVPALIGETDRLDGRRRDGRPHPDVARGAGRRARSPDARPPIGSGRGPTSSIPSGLELLRRADRARRRPSGRPRLPSRPDDGGMGACHPSAMVAWLGATSTSAGPARERYGIDDALLGIRGDLAVADLAAIRRLAAADERGPAGRGARRSAGEIGALGLLHEVGHLLIDALEAAAGGPTMAGRDARRPAPISRDDLDRLLDRFAARVSRASDRSPSRRSSGSRSCCSPGSPTRTRRSGRCASSSTTGSSRDGHALRRGHRRARGGRSPAGAALELGDGTKPRSSSCCARRRATPRRRSPASCATSASTGARCSARTSTRSSAGSTSPSAILAEEERGLHQRFGGGGGGTVARSTRRRSAARRRRARGVLASTRPGCRGSCSWPRARTSGSTSCRARSGATSGRSTRSPTRSSTGSRAGASPACGSSGCGSGRSRRSGSSGCAATPTPSPRPTRSTTTGSPTTSAARRPTPTCATAPGRAASGWPATWCPTTWASIRAGSSTTPSGSCRCREPPYPAYTFSGADLSPDERVGIVLEDHYWNDSDAAVVFKRFDRASGDERYIYHGNDGTSFPWNDTAQLDFLNGRRSASRSSRRSSTSRGGSRSSASTPRWSSPSEHIQRLWWPLTGAGDGIPSRAEYAMSQAEFDARMPTEFWREVVDRVAAEVPDTLLLAEAFWMLEGYFVRTLGMHRVYNSAFMHMLRDENGAGYRQAHPRDPRVRPGDPQALRQLHEQPGRGDGGRAVRQGRQVLRRRDGHGDAARPADARPRPGRGLRREVRHGVPARDARRAAGPAGSSSATSARSSRCSIGGPGSPRRTTSCCTTSSPTAAASTRTSWPTRTAPARPARWSSTTTASASTAGTIRESAAYARKSASGAKRLVRRSLAEGLGPARRPVDVRDLPRRPDGPRLPALVPRHPRARPVAGPRRVPGPRVLGVPRARGRVAGQWRRLAERLGGRGRAVARRGAARAPAGAGPRAAAGAVRRTATSRAVLDGTAERTPTSTCSRRGWRPCWRRWRRRPASAGDPVADRGTRSATRRRPRSATAADGLSRGDRAALLGWLVLSRTRRAGPGRRRRRRRAWPGTTSCAWRRSSRRASGRPGSTKAARGRRPTASACCSRCRARRTIRGRGRQRRPAPPRAAGSRATRSARPWGSTPGKAWSGSTATGSRRCSLGRPAGRDRDRPRRPTRRSVGPPRRGRREAPATGSSHRELLASRPSRAQPSRDCAAERTADASQSNRIRRSSDVGGAVPMTASRCWR